MSVQTRSTALQNEVVRLYCQFEKNGALANPGSQPSVQVLDTDGVTILTTLSAQLESTGIWYVDYAVPALLPLGDYYDQWTFQWDSNAGITEKTMIFSVFGLDSYINFVSPALCQDVSARVIMLMKDLTNEFIYEAQHIPVYWEQGYRVQQENQAKRVKTYFYFELPGSQYDIYKEAIYTNNSQSFTVFQDVLTDESSSSEGSGSSSEVPVIVPDPEYAIVLTTVGTGSPTSSGVLTKVSGEGPDTITYTAVTEKVSHFSTIYNFAYKNWLRDPRPILRLNNRIVDDGWYADYDGRIYIDGIMNPEDSVNVQYQFAYFSTEEILGFLRFGLKMMNTVPPASIAYSSLASMPSEWDAPVLLYAAVLALKRLVFGLNWQEKFVIFTRPDDPNSGNQAIQNFKDLYTDYSNTWGEVKKDVKTRKLPEPGMLQYVTPEYTLPGGRCCAATTCVSYRVGGIEGSSSISHLFRLFEEGKKIDILSMKDDKLVYAPVSKIWESGTKYTYILKTDSAEIRLSQDHLVFLPLKRSYIRVKELVTGDTLLIVDNGVLKEEKLLSTPLGFCVEPVFDIEVPSTENFVGDNIVSHNSRWFRYLYKSGV